MMLLVEMAEGDNSFRKDAKIVRFIVRGFEILLLQYNKVSANKECFMII